MITLVIATPQFAYAQDNPEEADQERLYFQDTGQVLEGPFHAAWTMHGGHEVTGSPVSPPKKIGNTWVQWFEYARFEIADIELEEATADDVERVPVGMHYANRFGYTNNHPAFKPLSGAPDGTLYFEETGHSVANGFRTEYERADYGGIFGAAISEEFGINGTTYQFFTHGALAWKDGTIQRVPIGTLDAMLNNALGAFQEQPEGTTPYIPEDLLWSDQFRGERWIEVDLSDYRLTAYIGDVPVIETTVVIGAPETPTVVGEFNIWWKLDSQTMEGAGPDGVEYRQEDVPWVMYFYQDWAIHGAYWRSSFGYAGSHGCVNVPVETSRLLYDFADVGTRVVVRE